MLFEIKGKIDGATIQFIQRAAKRMRFRNKHIAETLRYPELRREFKIGQVENEIMEKLAAYWLKQVV
jgi:hypothetical protein